MEFSQEHATVATRLRYVNNRAAFSCIATPWSLRFASRNSTAERDRAIQDHRTLRIRLASQVTFYPIPVSNPVAPIDPTSKTAPITSAPKNPSGPFVEVDDSSDDEQEAAGAPRKKYSRNSVTRFIGRPRNDTPIRSMQNDIVEQSRAMRAQAHKRAQEGLNTRANTVAPGAGNADVDMIDEQAFLGLPRRMGMP